MRKKNEKEYLFLIIITGIILVVLMFTSARSCSRNNVEYGGVKWNGNQQALNTSGEQQYIAVPGVTNIHFTANSPNQTVNFYNPKENKCLLSISILVQGYGVIWNEENIKPDYGVNSITINKKLDKGIYDANVLMSFSSLDGKTKLNSGNFKTKIIVG